MRQRARWYTQRNLNFLDCTPIWLHLCGCIYKGVILQNISVEIIAYVVPFYGVTEIAVNCFPIFKFAMKGGEFSQWTSIYIYNACKIMVERDRQREKKKTFAHVFFKPSLQSNLQYILCCRQRQKLKYEDLKNKFYFHENGRKQANKEWIFQHQNKCKNVAILASIVTHFF